MYLKTNSLVLTCCLLLLMITPLHADQSDTIDPGKANRVKAAYLYHLARLTIWPASAFDSDRDPLVIGIVGEDHHGLADFFKQSAASLKVGRHSLHIETMPVFDEAASRRRYHILFFTAETLEQHIHQLAVPPPSQVLLVGDYSGFCRHGGMVAFLLEDGHIRIAVNLLTVQAGSLKLSAEILQHAKLVSPSSKGED